MEQKSFSNEMTRTRHLVNWSSLSLLVLLLLGMFIRWLGGKPWFMVIEVLSGIALVVFFLSLAFLLSRYLATSEVREKRRLMSVLNKNRKEMETAQNDLQSALQKSKIISGQFQDQRAQAKERLTSRIAELQGKVDALKQAQEQELSAALLELQRGHVEAGLRAAPLDPAHIPGIGDMLAEKLQLAGIRTAWEVSQEAIQSVEGIGESKGLSLIRWRESLENTLRGDQPVALPDEMRQAILEKFSSQIEALQGEITTAQEVYEKTMDDLRQQEANELVSAETMETKARKTLATLENQAREQESQLAQYRSITFPKFFLAALTGGQDTLWKKALALVFFPGYFILGIAHIVFLISLLIQP